ncbi:branched-chain-amino-acid aminotransferase-like protein 2 [Asterias rubens]|uniref:branched-chain-amino-acid aminotransferase-like protein 2 n=1 Tax=Asterias rubens TaxID=7604 RepID=UPI001455667F|nr:branched-chain-amino-acid aminotransferase-like protein 2 [Asterias rubens]
MADDQQTHVADEHQQVRMMLWAVPRSTSTVFTKLMSFIDDSLIYFQPYLAALWFGQYPQSKCDQDAARAYLEKLSEVTNVTGGIQTSECTFSWAKEQLEKPHGGKKLIFCKDLCFSVADHYESLPRGYRHVFLIRHPLKVFASWRKIYPLERCEDFQLDEVPTSVFFPSGYAFNEMIELLDHVKTTLDPEPIIIDCDDLLRDPQGIISKLFKMVGLPFEDRYMHWEEGGVVAKQWVICNGFLQGHERWQYYKHAFASTCFTKVGALPDRATLTADVLRLADASMPNYDRMFAQRLTVQNVE